MLFERGAWAGLADGTITVAFRWWRRPTVRAGGTLLSPGGLLAIDDVRVVDLGDITDGDARRAGYPSRASLLAELATRPDGALYRVDLHRLGPDPRIELRERPATAEELDGLVARLDRLDRSSRRGPWTWQVLALIDEHPATRAADLAARLGRDTSSFKVDVRKLKAVGLTESLEVGYQLSPRGRALRAHAGR